MKEIKCLNCGTLKKVKNCHFNSGRAKYCSRVCMNDFRDKKSSLICHQCSVSFKRKKSLVKSKNVFCGKRCACLFVKQSGKKRTGLMKPCLVCQKKFYVQLNQIKKELGTTCSPKCRGIIVGKMLSGENGVNWKGGQYQGSDGYVYISRHGHPRERNGFVKRAVLIIEKKLGRFLRSGECVHHINQIKNDDSPENLMALSRLEHNRLHAELKRCKG